MTLFLVGLLAGLLVGLFAMAYAATREANKIQRQRDAEWQARLADQKMSHDSIVARCVVQLQEAGTTNQVLMAKFWALTESRLNPPAHDGTKEPTLMEADAAYAEQEAVEHV